MNVYCYDAYILPAKQLDSNSPKLVKNAFKKVLSVDSWLELLAQKRDDFRLQIKKIWIQLLASATPSLLWTRYAGVACTVAVFISMQIFSITSVPRHIISEFKWFIFLFSAFYCAAGCVAYLSFSNIRLHHSFDNVSKERKAAPQLDECFISLWLLQTLVLFLHFSFFSTVLFNLCAGRLAWIKVQWMTQTGATAPDVMHDVCMRTTFPSEE